MNLARISAATKQNSNRENLNADAKVAEVCREKSMNTIINKLSINDGSEKNITFSPRNSAFSAALR